MAEPIINPWLFYLPSFVESIRSVSFIVILFSALLNFLIITNIVIDDDFDRRIFKFLKIITTILAVSSSIFIVTPSSDSLYKMFIAQNVTKQNVEKVVENVEKITERLSLSVYRGKGNWKE